jgi:hypothetical protein
LFAKICLIFFVLFGGFFLCFFLGLRRKDSETMVRTYTFAAMVAVTYVALNEADSLFGWMARRQESKIEGIKLEREAARLRRQLMQELEEKASST